MATFQNSIYITIISSLKEFRVKRQFGVFSIQPLVDYNTVHHHFIKCIHVRLLNIGAMAGTHYSVSDNSSSILGEAKREQTPMPNKNSNPISKDWSETIIYKLLLLEAF